MNKKISLGVAITAVILAIALTVSGTMVWAMRYFSSMSGGMEQRQAIYDYIDEIDKSARNYYEIEEERIRVALANGYLEGLQDPYAEYLSAEQYKVVQDELEGNRTGFGLTVTLSRDNRLVISTVDPNSPAALAGIEEGDTVSAIDGEAMDGSLYVALNDKLNTLQKMKLSVIHDGMPTTVELAANTYKALSVKSRMLSESVGYIGIRYFNKLTAEEFKNAYNTLTKKGALYFVFDLRNNVGGSLDTVKNLLDYVLPRGSYAICTTKEGKEVFTAQDDFEITPRTVTLVNQTTTGEAEFFAAALRAANKTVLVGTGTQGKAVAQEYFSVDSDKAAVRLSVGTLSLVQSSIEWEQTGLFPDYTVELSEDKVAYFDLLTDEEDTQIQKALDVLKNSTVTENLSSTVTTVTATADASTTTQNE